MPFGAALDLSFVIAGLDPAIHYDGQRAQPYGLRHRTALWMPGSSPGMTPSVLQRCCIVWVSLSSTHPMRAWLFAWTGDPNPTRRLYKTLHCGKAPDIGRSHVRGGGNATSKP